MHVFKCLCSSIKYLNLYFGPIGKKIGLPWSKHFQAFYVSGAIMLLLLDLLSLRLYLCELEHNLQYFSPVYQ